MILLTRPLADSQRVAATLKQSGIASIISPVMEIEHSANAEQSIRQAITLLKPKAWCITSRHALVAAAKVKDRLSKLPLYAVGETQTDDFTPVETADTVDELAKLLSKRQSPLLYLSGEHTHSDLFELLQPYGIEVIRSVVYSGVEASALTAEAQNILRDGGIEAVALYSARSASVFFKLAGAPAKKIPVICISQAVAKACRKVGHAGPQHIAATPDGKGMIAQICLCHSKSAVV